MEMNRPDNARFRQAFNTIEAYIERRYGIPIVITDVPSPFTGDLDGSEIQVDHDQDAESALFVIAHLFGHTVQWNLDPTAREIGTMAVLGVFLKKLGWRWTMTIGILGHAARFAVFALFPDPGLAVGVNVLHGICYAFFFATVYIFVDEFFPKDVRSSAQGLFNLLILGIGPLVGNYVGPILGDYFKKADGTTDFSRMFLIPSFAALVGAVILALFFHPPEKATPEEPKPALPH